PQLSLLFRREPCPCMPLHSHTSSSAKIRRCCVDSLNSPPKADIRFTLRHVCLVPKADSCTHSGRKTEGRPNTDHGHIVQECRAARLPDRIVRSCTRQATGGDGDAR